MNTLFLHVDIDSPATLLKFWGHVPEKSGNESLERFYPAAMPRALRFFSELGVKATFFCVGRELETSTAASSWIRRAYEDGHEIANHTYTHPFSFGTLSEENMHAEIERGSDAIEKTTGCRPVGFRAPSYGITPGALKLLHSAGFLYDSSVFTSLLNPAIRVYHRLFRKTPVSSGFDVSWRLAPREPYYPNADDCLRESAAAEGPLEIPLPTTSWLRLPFYNNFHLTAGDAYRRFAVRRMRTKTLPYLFHLIEFADFSDGLPEALGVHPNVRLSVEEKLRRMRDSVTILLENYTVVKTVDFVSVHAREKSRHG